jgi:hypothetical protein
MWTAATAVAVALMQRPAALPALAPLALINVAFSPIYGLALLILVGALNECSLTPPPRLTEPGHWLLATIGSVFLGAASIYRVGSALESTTQPPPAIAIFLGAAVVTAASIAWLLLPILVFAAIHELRREAVWCFVFPLLLLSVLSLSISCCLGFSPSGRVFIPLVPTGVFGLMLITILIAAIRDLARREYRDLAHWLGVAAIFAVVAHLALLVTLTAFQ